MQANKQIAPSASELQDYSLGKLDPERAAEIESFLVEHPDCSAILEAAPDDDVVRHLRGAGDLSTIDSGLDQAATPPPGGGSGNSMAALAEHPRYRVLRKLGEGGMGEVFLAEHRLMQRPVALKVIRARCLSHPQAVDRFRREVHSAARLNHPNIVTAHDAEEAGGIHFLAMEYVDGVPLSEWLAEHGPLPAAEACRYAHDAALGLACAHDKGMVHRDLKPQNLMRTPDGTIKVLDFGLARFACETDACATAAPLTTEGIVMGTPDYMAPEQAQDSRQADIRADIYSLGCVLYELLAGRVPFPAGTPVDKIVKHRTAQPLPLQKLRPDLPPGLVAVVAKMMAKQPDQRYQTPADAAAALAPFTHATPPPRRRRRVALAACLLAGISLLAGAIYRIQTDTGELVIETAADDVEVVVKQGGKVVDIIDTARAKSITLRSGTYGLELRGGDGLLLDIQKATLHRGEHVLARIERIAPIPAARDEAGKAAQIEPADDGAKAAQVRVFTGHSGRVTNIAMSADGKTAVSVSEDNTGIVWDVDSGAIRHRLRGSPDTLWTVAISPDGKYIATGGQDYTVDEDKRDLRLRVWDAHTGMLLHYLTGPTQITSDLVFTDKDTLVSSNWDGTVRFWSIKAGGKEFREPFRLHDGVTVLAAAPSGRKLALGTASGDVVVMSRDQKEPLLQVELFAESTSMAAWVSEHEVAVAGGDHQPALIDVPSKRVRRLVGHTQPVHAIDVIPGGQFVVTSGRDDTIRIWSVADAREVASFSPGKTGNPDVMRMMPDGRQLFLAGADGALQLWRRPALRGAAVR